MIQETSAGITRARFLSTAAAAITTLPFMRFDSSIPERVNDLISSMTLAEKISQLTNQSAAIPRLGIPAYDWWNEALHGVARAGIATVFPQAIGLAATWNAALIERVGDTISSEARAKFNARPQSSDRATYHGLTFWAPNVNMFRDPRWGRGQETYGEDPCLTSVLASRYVRGMQGNDPNYLKAAACAKHFAVHSGPEPLRDNFNVNVDEQTLDEYYFPAFRALVRDARVAGVMSAYSSLNGTPCSANVALLRDTLRNAWGFTGYVTSDCGAVDDLFETYKIEPDAAHAAARSLKAGVDVSCGDAFASLDKAVAAGLVAEAEIEGALRHLLTIRFRLGLFDPPERVPYSRITPYAVDTRANATLALQVARESIVLLKNDGLLPLPKTLKRIALIGPNADSIDALLGNYNGTPSQPVTLLSAFRRRFPHAAVRYVRGCDYVLDGSEGEAEAAVAIARESDVVIFAGGISPRLEGEEMPVKLDGFLGGDRTRIELPIVQTRLLQSLSATGTPIVYVQFSGSAIATLWEEQNLRALVQVWYPGENGGTAIVDVLFGDYNPAGRLPVTFYRATSDLPPFEDYSVTNRTYRHFRGTPLFAFGHGLSYTRFTYQNLVLTRSARSLTLRFILKNAGKLDGDDVPQIYINGALRAFTRVHVKASRSKNLELIVLLSDSERASDLEVDVGASRSDIRLRVTSTVHN